MNNKEIETIIGIIEEAERHYILNKDEFLLKIKLEDMLKAKNNESLHDVSNCHNPIRSYDLKKKNDC